jgi:protein-S-isoprenylcysteine O-methyltransferase Ste14
MEESWLEEHFGESYLEYKRQVPRFMGSWKVVSPHAE